MGKIAYYILKAISLLPFPLIYLISDTGAFILHHIVGYRRKVVMENLRNSFPQKTDKEIRQIARKYYHSFCDTVMETVKMMTMSEKEIKKRLHFNDIEEVSAHLKKSRNNAIFMASHYANWEWLITVPRLFPKDMFYALYQTIENKFINTKLKEIREKHGMQLINASESYRIISRLPNNGKQLFCFVADQSPYVTHIRHHVQFLNQRTPAHIGAHQMAVKLNFNVYYFSMKRLRRGYYQIDIPLIYTPDEKVENYEIIDRYFTLLEEQINYKPEDWLWSHRRWKYKV